MSNASASTEAPLRKSNGTFQKGVSGHPGGRAVLPAWFIDKAPEALRYLLEVACGERPADKEGDRMKAAQTVVERYYGKPRQAIEIEADGADELLAALLRKE